MHTLTFRNLRRVCGVAFATSLLMVMLVGLGEPASAQALVFQFVGNGAFGGAGWTDGSISGLFFVGRSGTVKNPTTFLFYGVTQVDPCCTTLEGGIGSIPNGDLNGNGVVVLSLNTDTSASANPGFFRFAGDGGVIAIDWVKTSDWWTKSSGSSESHFVNFFGLSNIRTHNSGTSECSSASFQGSVFGTSVEGSTSPSPICIMGETAIGTNHQVSITVQQGP